MSESNSDAIAQSFAACFTEIIAAAPGLWQRGHQSLVAYARSAQTRIAAGADTFKVMEKVRSVADALVTLHDLSVGPEGRLIVTRALLALKTFVQTSFPRETVPDELGRKRMQPLLAQFRADGGVLPESSAPSKPDGKRGRQQSDQPAPA